ncbi:hypothetical protein [Actinoallomurus iriomotensis]|uniref:hypothetical protein n=1 Tax=Actinoallomurus iriomotensis TaxID=478107 RepID=UPI00255374D5|nr:hypothetical protein [Actinoallomurus iriomotensis]
MRSSPTSPARIVAAAVEMFGRIDVLVINAAITRPAPQRRPPRGRLPDRLGDPRRRRIDVV